MARINPQTNTAEATINVGVPGEGGDISIDAGYVRVSAQGIPVSQIDPAMNRLVRQFVGGERDDTLRVGFGSPWVIDEINGEIWRVGLKQLSQMQASPQ